MSEDTNDEMTAEGRAALVGLMNRYLAGLMEGDPQPYRGDPD